MLLKRQAELSLCVALKDSKPSVLNKTRAGGLIDRIANIALKEMDKTGVIDRRKAEKIVGKLSEFEKCAGWGRGTEKRIETYINTLLMILDKRSQKKIRDNLIDLIDFYERDGRKIPDGCFWSAVVNGGKWNKCFG